MATRELAVTPQDDFPEFSSRDKKVWLLLSMMGALAVLWVLLRIF